MDYRSPVGDEDDHPAASPWRETPPASPRRNDEAQFTPVSDASNGLAQADPGLHAFGRPDPSQESSQQSAPGSQPSDATAPSQPQSPPQQQRQQSGAQDQQQPPPARKPSQPQYKLQAKITGLERTGRKDPVLRFDVHTNIPKFRTTQFRDVRRLHSEFIKLAEHLISANPEALIPAVPPPLTSAGAGTDEDENRVKALLQRWLNYVCSNEVLMKDDEMVLFVESDFGYSPLFKRKQPATGVRRKLLKQFAPPPDDTPELAQARPIVKLFYLGSMDAGHKVDKLVKARRGMALSESDFGVKLGNMHVQEPHQGLANAYRKMGKIVQTVGDCHAAQATAEATTLSDPFQYHSQDAFIVKETLTNRQLLIREFLQAQEHTRSKLNAADRLKASSNVRREKVDEAIILLDDARNSELELMHKTQRVTQNLVHERRKWFARTAADLRLSIREFVCREIESERRVLSLLETVRPDIRTIDGSGGLSRLGRENQPMPRRTSLAQSQTPKGDAWSAAPRRTSSMSRSGSGFLSSPTGADDPKEGEEENENGSSSKFLGGGRPGSRSGLPGLTEEDDEDRVDARNAASRLATSTF